MNPPAPVMAQPQPQTAPVPPVTPLQQHDRVLRFWRLGFRVTTAVFIALALILFLAHGSQGIDIDSYSYSYSYYNYDYVSIPILAFAMIWNIAEFITFCVNKRGAHPGVHIGLDFVCFSALLSGGLVAIFRWGWVYYENSYYLDDDDDSPYGNVQIAVAAASMEIIACVFHFVLFVMACVATHRRRMRNKQEMRYLQTSHQSMYPGAYPPPPPGMVYMVTTPQQQPGYGQMPPQQMQQPQPQHVPQQMPAPSTQSPVSAAAVPTHSPTPELEHNDHSAWNTHGAHPGQPTEQGR